MTSRVKVLMADPFENAPVRGEVCEFTPEYVKLHGLVLRFDAYFEETVENNPKETKRVRKCIIYYFIEDGSIKIIEPRVANSGIHQGVFLKRHAASGVDLERLNVGASIKIYGFLFHVYACDSFTRRYLEHNGVDVPENGRDPLDDGSRTLPNGADARRATLGRRAKDGRGKFLTHDKKVLRFYCVWDDPARSCGDRRNFCLQYFLIDDTIAITEISGHQQNNQSGLSSTLLHRCRLPLRDEDAVSRGLTSDDFDYVTAQDLRVGQSIRVYKRDFFLYDCDSFTKSWYVTTHPNEYSELDFVPIDVSEPEQKPPANKIPEHTGLAIGSEEDSLQNCISLVPKPPRKDIAKEFAHAGCVLQFRAEMVERVSAASNVSEYDASRKFVVSFHVADQTFTIFEQPTIDSTGGKFLERGKLKKDGGFYAECDLSVGAVLFIHSRAFKLTDCDKFTENYLNKNE